MSAFSSNNNSTQAIHVMVTLMGTIFNFVQLHSKEVKFSLGADFWAPAGLGFLLSQQDDVPLEVLFWNDQLTELKNDCMVMIVGFLVIVENGLELPNFTIRASSLWWYVTIYNVLFLLSILIFDYSMPGNPLSETYLDFLGEAERMSLSFLGLVKSVTTSEGGHRIIHLSVTAYNNGTKQNITWMVHAILIAGPRWEKMSTPRQGRYLQVSGQGAGFFVQDNIQSLAITVLSLNYVPSVSPTAVTGPVPVAASESTAGRRNKMKKK